MGVVAAAVLTRLPPWCLQPGGYRCNSPWCRFNQIQTTVKVKQLKPISFLFLRVGAAHFLAPLQEMVEVAQRAAGKLHAALAESLAGQQAQQMSVG